MANNDTSAPREEGPLEVARGTLESMTRERRRQDAVLREALEALRRCGALSDPEDDQSAQELLTMLEAGPRRKAPSAASTVNRALIRI
jgi:hypothetical protein